MGQKEDGSLRRLPTNHRRSAGGGSGDIAGEQLTEAALNTLASVTGTIARGIVLKRTAEKHTLQG